MTSPIYAIVGPTCVGKTAVAIALAQRTGAEIISADSRQIYRHMDIGTAKPTQAEQAMAPHHLLDIVDPDRRFSAGEYGRQARAVLTELQAADIPPLIVGGAGLYIRALAGDVFTAPEIPDETRQRIHARLHAVETDALHQALRGIDPEAAARIHPNDRQRIVRALEVYEATDTPLTSWQHTVSSETPRLCVRMIGLQRDRADLYARINKRVEYMIEIGLIREVERLLEMGYTAETHALRTFGYAEIIAHLKDEYPLDEAVASIKQQTRRYAKRQMTWFRHAGDIAWHTLNEDMPPEQVCEDIVAWMQMGK